MRRHRWLDVDRDNRVSKNVSLSAVLKLCSTEYVINLSVVLSVLFPVVCFDVIS